MPIRGKLALFYRKKLPTAFFWATTEALNLSGFALFGDLGSVAFWCLDATIVAASYIFWYCHLHHLHFALTRLNMTDHIAVCRSQYCIDIFRLHYPYHAHTHIEGSKHLFTLHMLSHEFKDR